MIKKISILMIILLSLFICAFDAVYFSEMETPEVYQENEFSENETAPGEDDNAENGWVDPGFSDEPAYQDDTYLNENLVDPFLNGEENQNSENISDPTDAAVQNNEVTGEPEPAEEPAAPTWMDIDEDQVEILYALYSAMTDSGKSISGWFSADDYAPCTWNGITCEAGRVTKLTFKNAGFFTVFPEELLGLRDLKELHMVDTLVLGPLPENLFSALPKLEVLELKGNFLTGTIPELPAAFEFYPMLREITISDNLEDERKTRMMLLPEYQSIYYTSLNPSDYPEVDLTPGLDGEIPSNWNLLPSLSDIDLSGNRLTGSVPESFAWIQLKKLDLRDNAQQFTASQELYNKLVSLGSPDIILEGIQNPFDSGINQGDNPSLEETPAPPAVVPADTPDYYATATAYYDQQNLNATATAYNATETAYNYQQTATAFFEQQNLNATETAYSATETAYNLQQTATAYFDQQYLNATATAYSATETAYNYQQILNATATAYFDQKNFDATVTAYSATETVYNYQQNLYATATAYFDQQNLNATATAYFDQLNLNATATANYIQQNYSPTATPYYYRLQPYYYPTATPYYYQPQPYYYPTATPYYYQPQPYYYPTATPYYYQPQPYYYPTATPYYYQPQPYYYPTATPYTNYNPYYVYPTATSSYQYPQYVQVQPTQTSTPVPAQNPAAALGFTYKLEAMTGNNIPMTWRYTGMKEYSINYLDASGNLYPAFAMEWTPASKVCNASACNATVTVPDDLLKQGKFSLQLRVRDAAGNIYMSDPVMMEVSFQQPAPTPVPEQPKSFLAGFFEWLFGPLIRLFGGK